MDTAYSQPCLRHRYFSAAACSQFAKINYSQFARINCSQFARINCSQFARIAWTTTAACSPLATIEPSQHDLQELCWLQNSQLASVSHAQTLHRQRASEQPSAGVLPGCLKRGNKKKKKERERKKKRSLGHSRLNLSGS